MRNQRLKPGDTIKLKPRALGNAHPTGVGHILSCLPEEKGLVRYRVQFENETFERSIGLDDIDVSILPPPDERGATIGGIGSSWVNSQAIRAGKTAVATAGSRSAGKRHR